MSAPETNAVPPAPTPTQDAIDWLNVPSASGLVTVGGRKSHLSVRGPPRTPGTAVVVCESGLGHPAAVWAGVQSRCAPFIRAYAYDRAGYHYSDLSDTGEPRTAAVIAKELSELLAAAGVDGPYILVAHSFGGMLIREFIELRNEDVAGAVFVDVITERYTAEDVLPEADYVALLKDVDLWEATGNSTSHQLTPEEWDAVLFRGPNDGTAGMAERTAFQSTSEPDLAAKKQFERRVMGHKPVVVVKGNATLDILACANKGIELGNGTDEQRTNVLEFLKTSEQVRERHQRELLQLSTRSKWVVAQKGGHNVHITEPEVIADEIRAILRDL